MSETPRTYPAFPIPAVGAVIVDHDRVLLIQRGQAPAKGKWTIPGGAIEVGESPEEALIREIQEECGLTITIQSIVEVINKVIRDEQGNIRYHYIILDYLAYCPQDESLKARSDVINAHWVPLQELAKYDTTEGVEEVIQTALAMRK